MNKKLISTALAVFFSTSIIFTGCGGASKGTSNSNNLKTLVYAQPTEPVGLDPIYVSDAQSSRVISNVYEGLVRFKSGTTQVEPCLATNWDISPDGKTYTFKLRKGVKFHDGTNFNADAVKFNFERQMGANKKPDMPYATMIYGNVKEVDKIDDYTVKVILNTPFTPFISNLALSLGGPIVSPKAVSKYGKLTENPVGTGPFKFAKWDKGQTVTLEKNKDYWGNKAKIDKVIFKFIKENSTRTSELIYGSVDIAESIDPSDVQKLKENKINILKENTVSTYYAGFNLTRAPFNNPKLREAVYHAINTADIVKYAYQGYGEVAKTVLPPEVPGYDDTAKPYEYNVNKTKAILKETGNENLSIKIITDTTKQKLAESIQNYLAKAGIKASIQIYPPAEYNQKVLQGEGDIFIARWIGVNGDPDIFMNLFNSKEIATGLNMAKYNNPKVDELIEKGRTLPNGKEREDTYKQIQQMLSVDAPWINVVHLADISATSSKVKDFKMQPTGLMYLDNVDKN